jgi:hypothetical protein
MRTPARMRNGTESDPASALAAVLSFEEYSDIAETTAEPLQMGSVEKTGHSGPLRRDPARPDLAPGLSLAKGTYGSRSSDPPPEARAGFDGVTC